MDRLFRDWRYALLWVIGITTIATAYFAKGGGHEDLLAQSSGQPATRSQQVPAAAQGHPQGAAAAPIDDKAPQFGEPVLDTTPFDPNPVEAGPAPSAAPSAAAGGSAMAASPSSEPAPPAP